MSGDRRPWAWLLWLGAFLVAEIWAALKKTGRTLSEVIWRRWFPTKARRLLPCGFLLVLAVHLWDGGMHAWCGAEVIAAAGAPVVLAIGWAEYRAQRREGVAVKQKLVAVIAKWALGGIFRDIAEGKRGARLKRLYWSIAGKKRVTGAIIGVLFAAAAYFEPALAARHAEAAVLVIGLLVGWGFVDAAWRDGRPLPEWSAPFAKVASAGPALAAIVALLAEYLPQVPHCSWCEPLALKIQLGAAGVAAATGWLAARFASPPALND